MIKTLDEQRAHESRLIKDDFIDTVRALMDEFGVTQTELANRMGVATSSISRWFQSDGGMTLETAARIGVALGCRFVLAPVPKTGGVQLPRWCQRG